MRKRFILTLVLVGYSALLIKLVVFKGPMTLPEWLRPGRDESAERQRAVRGGGEPGRGPEGRASRRMGPPSSLPRDARLSTSRFAPLHANYVPFKTILPQLRGQPRWSSALMNLLGNTLLFAPVGFLVVLACPQMRWQKLLLLGLLVGVAMEVMEGVFRVGVVDIDDVILNALGVMSGYWLRRVSRPRNETLSFRPT